MGPLKSLLIGLLAACVGAIKLQITEFPSGQGPIDTTSLVHLVEEISDASLGLATRLVLVSFSDEAAPYSEADYDHKNMSTIGARAIGTSSVSAGSAPTVQVRPLSLRNEGIEEEDLVVLKERWQHYRSMDLNEPKCFCTRLTYWIRAIQPAIMTLIIMITATWAWTRGVFRGIRCCGLLALLAYLQYRGLAEPA